MRVTFIPKAMSRMGGCLRAACTHIHLCTFICNSFMTGDILRIRHRLLLPTFRRSCRATSCWIERVSRSRGYLKLLASTPMPHDIPVFDEFYPVAAANRFPWLDNFPPSLWCKLICKHGWGLLSVLAKWNTGRFAVFVMVCYDIRSDSSRHVSKNNFSKNPSRRSVLQ